LPIQQESTNDFIFLVCGINASSGLEDEEVWAMFKVTKAKNVALSSFPSTLTMLQTPQRP
jgi:hypothetical protein